MGFVNLLLLVLVDHAVVVESLLLSRDLSLALDVIAAVSSADEVDFDGARKTLTMPPAHGGATVRGAVSSSSAHTRLFWYVDL